MSRFVSDMRGYTYVLVKCDIAFEILNKYPKVNVKDSKRNSFELVKTVQITEN